MEQNKLWRLMARKLSGEATEEELEELNSIMRNYPESQYTYEVLQTLWKQMGSGAAGTEEERPLENRIKHYTYPEPAGEEHVAEAGSLLSLQEDGPSGHGRRKLGKRLGMAAAILVICGFLCYAYTYRDHIAGNRIQNKQGSNEVVTRLGSKTKIMLPDGTQVWLNAGSKLTYPNDFSNVATRETCLSGEAFFEVVHDPLHPFIIHTEHMDIKDLGTSFDVKSYPRDKTTEATLITGSIEVSFKKDPAHSIVLKPNEKITFYNRKDSAEVEEGNGQSLKGLKLVRNDPAHSEDIYKISHIVPNPKDSLIVETAWVENKLVFNGETFSDLAQRMERWYNIKIEFRSKAVENYRFTGVFSTETINQALDELKMISAFQYNVARDKIEVYK